jgi:hypothetical protein
MLKVEKGIYELTDQFRDLFWGIGYFGWQLATLYALYALYQKEAIYSILFFAYFALTGWINHIVLKHSIADLRPSNAVLFLASEHARKPTNGMPSGHAQQTALALTIAYLFSHQHFYESLALFLLTVTQRFVFRNHTLPQLVAGGLLGGLLGYIGYYLILFLGKEGDIMIKRFL